MLINGCRIIRTMRSFAEILLWTLPDTSPSEREDYIRIRQADAPEETLQTDFPIWFSVILNCYIGAVNFTADDGLILRFFTLVSVTFISLFLTSAVGFSIRDYVCLKVGFNVTNSYDMRPKNGRSASYVAQNWPGGSKHIETIRKNRAPGLYFGWPDTPEHPVYIKLEKLQRENVQYFRNQSSAWQALQIKCNLIGMLLSACLLLFAIAVLG
jgi:hypothetical protein